MAGGNDDEGVWAAVRPAKWLLRHPHWGCSCGEASNWACRDACRACGARAPRSYGAKQVQKGAAKGGAKGYYNNTIAQKAGKGKGGGPKQPWKGGGAKGAWVNGPPHSKGGGGNMPVPKQTQATEHKADDGNMGLQEDAAKWKKAFEGLRKLLGDEHENTLEARTRWEELRNQVAKNEGVVDVEPSGPSDAKLDQLRGTFEVFKSTLGEEHERTKDAKKVLDEAVAQRKMARPLEQQAQDAARMVKILEGKYAAATEALAKAKESLLQAQVAITKATEVQIEKSAELHKARATAAGLHAKLAAASLQATAPGGESDKGLDEYLEKAGYELPKADDPVYMGFKLLLAQCKVRAQQDEATSKEYGARVGQESPSGHPTAPHGKPVDGDGSGEGKGRAGDRRDRRSRTRSPPRPAGSSSSAVGE